MKRTAILATLLALVSGFSAACGGGHPPSPKLFTVISMKSPAGQAEILLVPPGPVRGLVVFEHGYGETQLALLRTSQVFRLRDALLSAGFAMAASYSHGNNMGSLVSIHDQQLLLQDAQKRLGPVRTVEVVGFSMGGLDALLVASRHVLPDLDAVLLLSPMCDQVPFLDTSDLGPPIRAAFGHKQGRALIDAMAPSNPEQQDPRSYTGFRYWFWQSPADTTVPPAQTDGMISLLRSAGIQPRYTPLTGNHGDLAALQPQQIVQWFEDRG